MNKVIVKRRCHFFWNSLLLERVPCTMLRQHPAEPWTIRNPTLQTLPGPAGMGADPGPLAGEDDRLPCLHDAVLRRLFSAAQLPSLPGLHGSPDIRRPAGPIPARLAAAVRLALVYVLLAPALLPDRRALWSYLAAVVALSVVGFGIFLIWPTAVPKPEIPWPEHTLLSYLKVVDASGNAFPSLHTAFAVFTAAWLGRLLRGIGAGGIARALNWLWCAGIVYSTLATRQHVALDALAGAALGAAGALIHFRILGALRARSGSA